MKPTLQLSALTLDELETLESHVRGRLYHTRFALALDIATPQRRQQAIAEIQEAEAVLEVIARELESRK